MRISSCANSRVDPPIAPPVGVGERVARHLAANAHVVELAGVRPQADLDVAQTLPVGELRKSRAQELAQAREGLDVPVSAVAPNAFSKNANWQMVHHLGEHERA